MSREIKEISAGLQQGKDIVVATVIENRGSTPRTSGSKMVIYEDGRSFGTIGGGAVEGDVIRLAKELFQTRKGLLTTYDLNRTGVKDAMDLICGGVMDVLLEYVPAGTDSSQLYEAAVHKLQAGHPFIWQAVVETEKDCVSIKRTIIDPPSGTGNKTNGQVTVDRENGRVIVSETVSPEQSVYIFGGGHVSLEIVSFIKRLGWQIHVFDDREEFANSRRFPTVDGIHVCPGFTNVFEPFHVDADSSIIIVTRGHSFDKKVLSQALRTNAGYIGMIGSRKKRDTIYEELQREGVAPELFKQVHSPIGLDIGAETPAEIGISIVAELVQHRVQ